MPYTKKKRFKRRFIKPMIKFIEFNAYRLTGKNIRPQKPEPPVWPAGLNPDMLVLTPAAVPATMQTFNWRTSSQVIAGAVQYRAAKSDGPWQIASARRKTLNLPELNQNAQTCHFTATITGLTPATTYAYRVGSSAGWSAEYHFTTLPGNNAKISFVYLGDAQKGFTGIGQMLNKLERQYPATAFYLMAGDFVNSGEDRNAWDKFLSSTNNAFARKFLAPAPGNHDYHHLDPKGPVVYVKYFELPPNGAPLLPPNHSYSFSCGKVFFITPDTNKAPFRQTRWLKKQLQAARQNGFKWIIVLMHHPVYSAKGRGGKRWLRTRWRALFDEYNVDLVLTGHDHSYMRSVPLRNGQPAANGAVYVISTVGSQFYHAEEWPLAACQKTEIQTYQIIDIIPDGGRETLHYRAFDFDDNLVDEFYLKKPDTV